MIPAGYTSAPRERLAPYTLQLSQIIEMCIPITITDPVLRESHGVVMSVEQLVYEISQRCDGLGWFDARDFQQSPGGRPAILIRHPKRVSGGNRRRERESDEEREPRAGTP